MRHRLPALQALRSKASFASPVPILAVIAGVLVLVDYARRRRRGADPLGVRPVGALPDTLIALLCGALLWFLAREGLYFFVAGSQFLRDGGFAANVLISTALNFVIALALLRSALGGTRRPSLSSPGLVVAGALAGLVVFALQVPIGLAIQQVCAYLGGEIPRQEIVTQAQRAHGAEAMTFAVGAIVLAPFAEEVFFRGILLPAVARSAGERRALFIQALAFGAIHVNAWHMWPLALPLAVVGWCSGWLYLRTGSLAPSIVLHAAFNAINFAALRLA